MTAHWEPTYSKECPTMDSTTATTPRPPWASGDYGVSYEDVVNSWGYHVHTMETCGSYQGDIVVIVADGLRAGWVVIGYGSCSGCDALQAAEPWGYDDDEDADWTGVVEIRDSLLNDIHWEDNPIALAAWLEEQIGREDGASWWAYDDEVKAVARHFIEVQS